MSFYQLRPGGSHGRSGSNTTTKNRDTRPKTAEKALGRTGSWMNPTVSVAANCSDINGLPAGCGWPLDSGSDLHLLNRTMQEAEERRKRDKKTEWEEKDAEHQRITKELSAITY